jgi:NAD+ kinase
MGKIKVKLVAKKDYPELSKVYNRFEVVEEPEEAEFCMIVGGDGTFLRAAANYPDLPFILVRSDEPDSLGFHADVSIRNIDKLLDDLEKGLYEIKFFKKIRAEFKEKYYDAVNDIWLDNSGGSQVSCKVYRYLNGNKELLYPFDLKGDGINFCTYIGATAYNKKIGGPIIAWETDVIVAMPRNTQYNTPIVSKDDFFVEVTKQVGVLYADISEIGKVNPGEGFRVTFSDKPVKIVKMKNFYEPFCNKLLRQVKFDYKELFS